MIGQNWSSGADLNISEPRGSSLVVATAQFFRPLLRYFAVFVALLPRWVFPFTVSAVVFLPSVLPNLGLSLEKLAGEHLLRKMIIFTDILDQT